MTAAVRNCVGVDIGSDWIRVANLEMTRQGPRVLDLVEERIELEADLPEDKRFQAIAKQIQDMLKNAKIRTRNAIFCVPGQSVFVRRIRLPRAKPDQMNRMVRYEARQQIPFPLEKTIMEYQVFEEEGLKEVHVLLVAIKRDFINNFMKLIRQTRLKVLAISVSSIALYNFHQFNSFDQPAAAEAETVPAAGEAGKIDGKPKRKGLSLGSLFKKKEKKPGAAAVAVAEAGEEAVASEAEPEMIQAYVNLGASLMDLAIPKPGSAHMVGFVRSVPLAGNEMDRAIRDKLKLQSLDQARQVKERETSILSTEFESDEDAPQVNVDASEAATSVADRVIGELRRSLDFYISQPDGVAVDGIVLSGGLARMRHLVDYVEEKMGMPVVQAEPLHEKLRMPDAMPDHFAGFAVAIGLSLQGLGLGQNKIDFLPEDVKTVRGLQERKLEVAGMVAMLGVIILLSMNVGVSAIDQMKEQSKLYSGQIQTNQAKNNEMKLANDRYTQLAQSVQSLDTIAGVGRDYQLQLMKFIVECRPPEVLVDNIVLRADGLVFISGKARDIANINSFIKGLQDLSFIVFDPKIYEMTPDQTDPRFNTAMFRYTIIFKTVAMNRGRIRIIGERPLIYQTQAASGGSRGGGRGMR